MVNISKYVPYYKVKINQQELTVSHSSFIREIIIDYKSNESDVFSLTIENYDLRWIDKDPFIFAEGNEIEINYGFVNSQLSTFIGEITAIEAIYPGNDSPVLVVRGEDLSTRLKRGKSTKTYRNITYSDIAQQIAGNVKLTPDVTSTTQKYDSINQINQSDFLFLKDISKKCNYNFWVDGKTLCFKENKKLNKLELEWGKNLMNLQINLNLYNQVKKVKVYGWDPDNKKEVAGEAERDSSSLSILSPKGQSLLSIGSGNKSEHTIVDRSITKQKEAEDFAESAMKKIVSNLIKGYGTVRGESRLKDGTVVNLTNVGSRFEGSYDVVSANHVINMDGYITNFVLNKRYGK